MVDGDKGSTPRPFSVDRETFESNWEVIFGQSKKYFEKPKNRDLEEKIIDHSGEDR